MCSSLLASMVDEAKPVIFRTSVNDVLFFLLTGQQ